VKGHGPETALVRGKTGEWSTPPSARREADVHPANSINRETAREIFQLVFQQMRTLVGPRPEFDDLVQIAAEQVLLSLGSFEGRAKMSTWTYRICYFTLLRHERWYRRWLRRFALSERGELPEVACGDDAVIETRERAARLRRAIDSLSPKRRAVIVLHDLEGLPIDEVATVVKCNPNTVRSRLRDGRKELGRILAADGYFGDEACFDRETER
jgi:RNA polymerase sigma-70 factor (ECF subfamily)